MKKNAWLRSLLCSVVFKVCDQLFNREGHSRYICFNINCNNNNLCGDINDFVHESNLLDKYNELPARDFCVHQREGEKVLYDLSLVALQMFLLFLAIWFWPLECSLLPSVHSPSPKLLTTRKKRQEKAFSSAKHNRMHQLFRKQQKEPFLTLLLLMQYENKRYRCTPGTTKFCSFFLSLSPVNQ